MSKNKGKKKNAAGKAAAQDDGAAKDAPASTPAEDSTPAVPPKEPAPVVESPAPARAAEQAPVASPAVQASSLGVQGTAIPAPHATDAHAAPAAASTAASDFDMLRSLNKRQESAPKVSMPILRDSASALSGDIGDGLPPTPNTRAKMAEAPSNSPIPSDSRALVDELVRLRLQVGEAKDAQRLAAERAAASMKDVAALREQNSALKAEVARLKNETPSTTAASTPSLAAAPVATTNGDLTAAHTALVEKMAKMKEEFTLSANKALEDKVAAVAAAQEALTKQTREFKQLQEEFAALQPAHKKLQDELAAAQRELNEARPQLEELENLQAINAASRIEVEEFQSRLEEVNATLSQERASFTQQIARVRSEAAATAEDFSSTRKQVEMVMSQSRLQVAAAEKERDQYRNESELARKQVIDIQGELQAARAPSAAAAGAAAGGINPVVAGVAGVALGGAVAFVVARRK